MSTYFTNQVKKSPPRYGRLAGTKNKTHATVRWGLIEAYRQLGGVEGLVHWGKGNPDAFYPLLAKLIPAEMAEAGLGQDRRIQVVIVPSPPLAEAAPKSTNRACLVDQGSQDEGRGPCRQAGVEEREPDR